MNISYDLLSPYKDNNDIMYEISDGSITYKEFVHLTFSIAADFIHHRKIRPRDKIILCMPDGIEWMAYLHASILVGATPVLISNRISVDKIQDIKNQLDAKLIIDSPLEISSDLDTLIAHQCNPTDLALITTTSGTTSNQKLVGHTHASLQYLVDNLDCMRISQHSRILCTARMSFVVGLVWNAIMVPKFGCQAYILENIMQIKNLNSIINERKITDAFVGVFGIKLMLKQRSNRLGDQLRRIVTGGEPLPPTVADGFYNKFSKHLTDSYGLTESLFTILCEPDDKHRHNCIGHALFGSELQVRDDADNLCPDGKVGRLWIKSKINSKSYIGKPDHDLFQGDWLRTNDLVYRREDLFYFVSRVGQSIKINGELVSATDVESILLSIPGIEDCVCVFDNNDIEHPEILAGIVSDPAVPITKRHIVALLEKNSLRFLPNKIYHLREISQTITNKKIRSKENIQSQGKLLDVG